MIGHVTAVDFDRKVTTIETMFGPVDVRIADPDAAAALLFQRVQYDSGVISELGGK